MASAFTRLGNYQDSLQLTDAKMGELLLVSGDAFRNYRLKPSDAKHRRPPKLVADRMKLLTCGAIHAGNFDDPVDDRGALVPPPSDWVEAAA